MTDVDKIINCLRNNLENRDDVYALWIEGSMAQGFADEYSDIDLWLCVDDDKIFLIYSEVENALKTLGNIDFKYIVKKKGELGQNVYHISGMNKFLHIDINTQGISRNVYLVSGIDDARIVFDKKSVVKFKDRDGQKVDIDAKRLKLKAFFEQMEPSVIKSLRRGNKLEAIYYFHMILRYATKFLHLKYGLPEKADFDLKHIYRDIPKDETDRLELFYDTKSTDIESALSELKSWVQSL